MAKAPVASTPQRMMTEATRATATDRLFSNDNWKYRRRAIFASLIFLSVCIGYLVFLAPDDELRRGLGIPLAGTFASIIMGYAFAAVLDDNNKRTMLAETAEPPAETE